MSGYDHKTIEARWQRYWAERSSFAAPNPGDDTFEAGKPKFYVLDMFPYPSGAGLHVGHPLGYIATDIVARFQRMRGYNVLHPMGFDAFGLPAEQYAIDHGVHPRTTTEQNIENMRAQLKRLGLSYDWDRQLATTDIAYYKWTQWIFLQLYHSYFDEAERRARPIGELVRQLENEQLYVGPDGELVANPAEGLEGIEGDPVGARKWHELSQIEQQRVLAQFRLAYLDEVPVNWCPALGTVLANEEVTNEGRSERGNHPVYRRPLTQWMLRITAYADRLIDDLERVDWPDSIKLMQRNWIGRSYGAEVWFPLADGSDKIRAFTTRPDTLFGATYMVLAPEHPLVEEVTTPDRRDAVRAYQRDAAQRSEDDRAAESKDKTGVFTGAYATNPANGENIPIYIADYVMMGYGTGAIMAVPAHDERDFAFAHQNGLPIRAVVMPDEEWLKRNAPDGHGHLGDHAGTDELHEAYRNDPGSFADAFTGEGTGINSANSAVSLNGRPTSEAKEAMIEWLEYSVNGERRKQYKLRDWLFSRQRYWGEPFPVLHGPNGEIRTVSEDELPVELPDMERFAPEGSDDPDAPPQPPLSRAPDEWKYVEIDGVRYQRELNTMPQWAGSCWYYLRFCDPRNGERFVGEKAERYWMNPADGGEPDAPESTYLTQSPTGVDLYVGGAEHAVLHLLYARFWHKVLYDLGHVTSPEPFGRLYNQGYIQAYAYRDERGVVVPADEVVDQDGNAAMDVQDQPGRAFYYQGQPVTQEYGKMGKSLKNALSPEQVCDEYGADTLRLYEMYMGPLEASKPWSTRDIVGVHRFLKRVWRHFIDDAGNLRVVEDEPTDEQLRTLHQTIKRVTDDMHRLSFNTAIAALIELNNAIGRWHHLPRAVAEPLVLMLAPMAPHIAEELWHRLGREEPLSHAPWPGYDEQYLTADEVELVVQIKGKVRGRITVPADADEEAIRSAALNDEKIAEQIDGKDVKKVIVVPGKLVNIVAN